MIGGVEAGPTLRFATVARRLGAAARAAGLVAPSFRSPPRIPAAVRTIRRYDDGVVVAVRTQARPFDRVAADMIEGVLEANDLEGRAAHRVRLALWEVAADGGLELDDPVRPPSAPAGGSRSGADGADLPDARMAERQTQAA